MRKALIVALSVSGVTWAVAVLTLHVIGLVVIWREQGFWAVMSRGGLYDVNGFLVLMVAFAPAAGAFWLANRLSDKR